MSEAYEGIICKNWIWWHWWVVIFCILPDYLKRLLMTLVSRVSPWNLLLGTFKGKERPSGTTILTVCPGKMPKGIWKLKTSPADRWLDNRMRVPVPKATHGSTIPWISQCKTRARPSHLRWCLQNLRFNLLIILISTFNTLITTNHAPATRNTCNWRHVQKPQRTNFPGPGGATGAPIAP